MPTTVETRVLQTAKGPVTVPVDSVCKCKDCLHDEYNHGNAKDGTPFCTACSAAGRHCAGFVLGEIL